MTQGAKSLDSADSDTGTAVDGGIRRGGSDVAERSKAERRRLVAALILSAAAHALAFGIRFDVRSATASRGVSEIGQVGLQGTVMRAVDLVITTEAVPPRLAEVEAAAPKRVEESHRADVGSEARDAPASTAVEAGWPNGADTRTGLRERLAPRMTDRRLWLDPAYGARAEVEEAARIRAPIRDRVAAINDSIAAAEERERKASDWTERDAEGRRWGISPDRVHLGGLMLKLRYCTVEPCEGWLFPTPADRKDEYEDRRRGFAEIRLQASRVELEQVLGARATAIRKRMDAQRDSSRGGDAVR